jgi:hypothetical protein
MGISSSANLIKIFANESKKYINERLILLRVLLDLELMDNAYIISLKL